MRCLGRPRRRSPGLSAAVFAIATGSAWAQADAGPETTTGRTFSIVPNVAITETLTDNSRLATNGRQSDLITQVSPGLRIDSTGGRVKGFLDYRLTGLVYARNSGSNEIRNSLNASANVEAVENWAFLDASANIAQQAVSAYGTQSGDSPSVNANRTEVRTFNLSPYVRGKVADLATYEARFTQGWTRGSSSAESDNTLSRAALGLEGESGLRLLSWSVDATHQLIDFKESRQTEDDRVRGALHYAVDPQLRLSLILGRESSNYASAEKQGRSTPGWGLDWTPTERTRLSMQSEQRTFGNSHAIVFEHRTPRTVWTYSDTRDVTTGFGQSASGSQGTVYDLLFTQFASLQPDPALREKLVTDFLQTNGIQPTAQVFTGSQASAVTLQRQQQLSFAWLGIRDTLTFVAIQSEARRIDTVSAVVDDFANGNRVRLRGFSLALAHRLTPQSALNLVASVDRTSGSTTTQATRLRTISLGWTGRLGAHSNASLIARHSRFDGTSEPYSESALAATVSLWF